MLQNNGGVPYRPLEQKVFAPLRDRQTAENRYWSKFKAPQETITQVAPISHLEFSAASHKGHPLVAATTSTRICLYDAKTKQLVKSLTRFEDTVYSGSFRRDGKLMVAGGKKPVVRVCDVNSRSVLRSLTGHAAPIHVTRFSLDQTHVFSSSDDKTSRYWDLPTEKIVSVLPGHQDYIRTGTVIPGSDSMWITGSYDHSVKLWDVRGDASNSCTMTLDHGCPVESTLVLPGGSLVASAGGNVVKVWDMLSGGKLLHSFSNHQKTITSLNLDGTNTRLMSGSLDGHIKVYDLASFSVTHGFKFDAGVLSFAISRDNTYLVAGTTDRVMACRDRKVNLQNSSNNNSIGATAAAHGGTLKYFLRGRNNTRAAAEDHVITVNRHVRIASYDKALRKFEYKEALDAALDTRLPVVVASMLEELKFRGGLERALAGRNEASLEPLLSFLIKYSTSPRYAPLLLPVCNTVCDLYFPVLGQSLLIDELFVKLVRKLREEMQLHQEMLGLVGIMDTLLAAPASATKDQLNEGSSTTV